MPADDISRPRERPEDGCARKAGLQHGLITRAQARQCGMSDSSIARRLASGSWRARSGVLWLPGFTSTWQQEVMFVILRGGPETCASHRSAARLLGFEGVSFEGVEVYAPTIKSTGRTIVHRATRLPPCDLAVIADIPTTNASRTLLDLGAVVEEETVEIALEFALRRGMTSVRRLRWRLQEVGGRGHRGSGTLRRLLDLRDPATRPARSVLEVKFVRGLRNSGLPTPVRQFEVRVGEGRRRYIDFAFPHARLGVEVGGREFHSGPAAEQRDSARHNELLRLGWRLLYFTWDDVEYRLDHVIECIGAELVPALPAASSGPDVRW